MKQIVKVLAVSLVALVVFIGANAIPVKAQTAETEVEYTLVSTVNIYSATNTKIGNKTYSISFEMHNKQGIQSDIRYGIQLVNRFTSKPVDMYLVNEAITLGEKDSKQISLEYTIPDYVPDGVYRMLIISQNQNGLLLASSPISIPEKFITIENSSGIDIKKCYLTVEGEDPGVNYTISEGVAIRPDGEKIRATCEIQNSSFKSDDLKLQLITHKRNQLGDILANNVLEQVVTVKSRSTQTISFPVPTLTTPQAYDIDTFLINEKGEKVSYSVFLHYVVSGVSATIQNAILDKTDYLYKDVAELRVLWTASADTFTNSRIPGKDVSYILEANIKNSAGEICGSISKNVKSAKILEETLLNIDISRDCSSALAEVVITDTDGNILDTTKIDLNNPVAQVQINPNVPLAGFSFANFNTVFILIFIVVLVLIAYGILVLRKDKVEKK